MKPLAIIILCGILFVLNARQCTAADSTKIYYRATEGAWQKVNIDTNTPLPQLINKFLRKWDLVMTGKAYWIGYTDNMYAIANYGDEAIAPLTAFIDTTHSPEAKKGALYTLHLIGINATVVGRTYEDFENKNARNALRRYMKDTMLTETVVYLLMRDPWLSDVPTYMAYLEMPDMDYSKVLSALRRYAISNPPLDQQIPDSIANLNIPSIEPGSPLIAHMYALQIFHRNLGDLFMIDSEIAESSVWVESRKYIPPKRKPIHPLSIGDLLLSPLNFSFSSFTHPYYYAFEDGRITIYGQHKARQKWLNWWQALPQVEKNRLLVLDHIPLE